MKIIRENQYEWKVLNENGIDYINDINMTDLHIIANSEETKAVITTTNPKLDLEIDNVEVKCDFEKALASLHNLDTETIREIMKQCERVLHSETTE